MKRNVVLRLGAIALISIPLGCADLESADPVPLELPSSVGPTPTSPSERPRGIYVPIPDELWAQAPARSFRIGPGPRHRIIYLNRYGGTFTYGFDDAARNVSSIPRGGSATISAWSWGDAKWNQTVQCVRNMYARFNVTVTDVDPGDVDHVEAVVGGTPQQAGLPSGVGGVSPFDPGSCNVIERAVTFNFAGIYGGDVQAICEVVAQETAHAFGLDHEFLCEDPMTYLSGCGPKSFQDVDARCGEGSPRDCQCGTPTQNSVRHLLTVLGPAGEDLEPPRVRIARPADGATVQAGFNVAVDATDNVAVSQVELYIDGMLVKTDTTAPFDFATPTTLPNGPHRIQARAYDMKGQEAPPHEITVNVTGATAPECATKAECGSSEDCVAGRCVPAGTAPGGTGWPCSTNEECVSGLCAGVGDDKVCSETCAPGDDAACPVGYSCAETTTPGVGLCWPTAGAADPSEPSLVGGCAVGDGGTGAAADGSGLLLCGFALALAARRRRRASLAHASRMPSARLAAKLARAPRASGAAGCTRHA